MKNRLDFIRKTGGALLCALLLLAVLPGQKAFAANNVSDISVDVVLYDDGSAYITQTWNCSFSEGTEGYIPIGNLGEMTLSDFLVSDENGPYTCLDDWDVGAGFDEKAGKCGIVETAGGYELCWGITRYGERRYAIEYKISKLAGAYTDYDGFNFQFINSGMGTLPTDVTVKLALRNGTALDAGNAGIWAFGFKGQIAFEDGGVRAYTEKALSAPTESVIVMLQLDKGVINPVRSVDESFETVKERAFAGSDYGNDTDSGTGGNVGLYGPLIAVFAFAALAVMILLLVIPAAKKNKSVKALYKSADYFREVPLSGNIEAAFVLAKDFGQLKNEGDLIGAAFLKLINLRCLEPVSEKSVGLFGKEKPSVSMRLVRQPELAGLTAQRLYGLLEKACGSDRILQEKELEKYCRRHDGAIQDIIKAAKKDGRDLLARKGCYDVSGQAKPLGLSQSGQGLLQSLMGFKKYLLEFSLIGERTIAESVIWQDFLTFAALLGIADKAMAQFEKVYPEATVYSANAHYYFLAACAFRTASYDSSQAARSSGGGGGSSFGGGGGFSGGGSGGGTR
ncbi:MAG: DUF2207 domain-containing protein [Oscillospiraceae bacterium]|jgi:hypothetical protein|nr:DUF2207 domain-containing protein [Oscillospiraceae bacterium]